jgi:hypothetical protein
MPDEVGHVLQTAQDDLQPVLGNPLFISVSKDATGAARHQTDDRDWIVCRPGCRSGSTAEFRYPRHIPTAPSPDRRPTS